MRAGLLSRQVTFRRKSIAYDGNNEQIETWADAFTVWAEVQTSEGREFYAAQKKNVETSVLIKVRYNASINGLMRVKFDGQEYEILHVSNVKSKFKENHVAAKEVT